MPKTGTFLYTKDETDRGEEKRITGTDLNSVRHLNIASKLLDENGNYTTDSFNNAIIQMDWEHHCVHEGIMFHINIYDSVTAGTPKYCQLKTGASYIHLKQKSLVDGADTILCTFLEEATVTDGSTEVPILNKNRNSSNTSTMTVYSDPTEISGGTVLEYDYLYGLDGFLSNIASGLADTTAEWILKPNTDYIYKLENLGDGDATFLGKLMWYERS